MNSDPVVRAINTSLSNKPIHSEEEFGGRYIKGMVSNLADILHNNLAATSEKTYILTCAPSVESDQSARSQCESSLCAFWIAKDAKFLHADNEDSDQTVRLRRLIRVLPEHTRQTVRDLMLRLICFISRKNKITRDVPDVTEPNDDPVHLEDNGADDDKVMNYSITSMARTRMARLPWMIRTLFSVPTKSFQ